MATGALDANGIWQYGEDDSNSTFSALLNRLATSTSDVVADIQAALPVLSGVIPVTPISVDVTTGTATVNSLGTVAFTGATSIILNDVFTSSHNVYKIILNITGNSATSGINAQLCIGGVATTGTGYTTSYIDTYNGTSANGLTAAASSFNIGSVHVSSNTGMNSTEATILNPALADDTRLIFNTVGSLSATGYIGRRSGGGTQSSATAFDGIRIYPAAGNFTGTVQVLAIND